MKSGRGYRFATATARLMAVLFAIALWAAIIDLARHFAS